MGNVSLPNNLTNGNPADASQVMGDFNAIVNVINGSIDNTDIASGAAIDPTKVSGTAITQNNLNTIDPYNIVFNPYLYGQTSPLYIPNWTLNTNATYTANDTSVTTGVNSISDANASDLWVCQQTINTSLSATGDAQLVPGKTYTVSADVKTTSGSSTVYIAVQNASTYSALNTNIANPFTYNNGSGTYQRIYSTFTVPASCTNINICLVKSGTTTSVSVSDFTMTAGAFTLPVQSNPHLITSGYFYPDTLALNGWFPVLETWTYASFTASSGAAALGTFTVPGDLRTRYDIGDSIQFTNNSVVIYGIITGLSYSTGTTTVTYCTDGANSVTNSAFSSVYFSKVANAHGMPRSFSYTATIAGFSANPTVSPRFTLKRGECTIYFAPSSDGTSNATNFTITAPFTASSSISDQYISGRVKDNGTEKIGLVYIGSNTSTITIFNTVPGTTFTASGAKNALFNLTYLTNL